MPDPATYPTEDLPLVLAGPMLRRVEKQRVVLWLATRAAVRARIELELGGAQPLRLEPAPGTPACRVLTAGTRLHYLLLDLRLDTELPAGRWIGYRVALAVDRTDEACSGNDCGSANALQWFDTQAWAPDLCYPGRDTPGFVFAPQVASLLHGSCRKPHHHGGDGLVRADALLAELVARNALDAEPAAQTDGLPAWPSALVMTGDQIYADDVAGPMLRAIHGLIGHLGLPVERLEGIEEAGIADADALYRHRYGYYRRDQLLPQHKRNYALIEVLFGGVEKPVFTSASAHNHLITLAEVLAMYLLVWSPEPWRGLDLEPPPGLAPEDAERYADERRALAAFTAELPAVRRVLAHIPVAMIFDDHDVTDDWNLSREWEEIAYGHPFSRRIIGNALLAYALNQAWGNRPETLDDERCALLQQALAEPGGEVHEQCIKGLLHFEGWHYIWPTTPPLVVIDTRTQRWRSEHAARSPSGLMDWESLTDLQHTLRDLPAVLLVSPAPIFGVKLIEAIQRVFTWFGHPLMVDAENWMAHPGSAQAILNIFRHRKTPRHFVVLSGDVHYSFVYDVELRGRLRGPDIWQICSSGLRNEFPPRLLGVLDRLNRWLYSPRSPLNWFTRRRHMRVTPRRYEGASQGRRLLNGAGIGLVELDTEGVPWRIRELLADGQTIAFERDEGASRWD
ncbi:MAG: alkaline phosphatase family protein [Thauera sp.]|nr:alkaline phosphatase family protein [Thauera sp.]